MPAQMLHPRRSLQCVRLPTQARWCGHAVHAARRQRASTGDTDPTHPRGPAPWPDPRSVASGSAHPGFLGRGDVWCERAHAPRAADALAVASLAVGRAGAAADEGGTDRTLVWSEVLPFTRVLSLWRGCPRRAVAGTDAEDLAPRARTTLCRWYLRVPCSRPRPSRGALWVRADGPRSEYRPGCRAHSR